MNEFITLFEEKRN